MFLTRPYPIAAKRECSVAGIQLPGSLIYREERYRDTEIQRWCIYSVELTERKKDGETDRDRERELDRDGDRCPLKNYFMSLRQDIQALHLSDKSLDRFVSCQNWRSTGGHRA